LLLTLLLAGCSSPPVAQPPDASQPFASEIQQFLATDRTNPPPKKGILFVGSSSIRLWKTLAQDFPGQPVYNRGFGGSQIIDSVRYADLIILPYRPKRIVIYAGGNDINAGKSPEQVFADFQTLATKIRTRLPKTEINYISIAPNPARWAQVEKVRATNRLIEDYARHTSHITYIDVFSHMLGADGQPKPDIYVADRLHMNENGYALWKQLVGPYLN
jgi:lysophospholipase L1-like esterase